jgi:hypothetical protein
MERRIRSPNYPALSLPEAMEKVAAVYRGLHNHAAPREVVAKEMGYAGLNGASATAISALRKYGLLDRTGEDLKVSERALRILHPHSSAERSAAIREAAHEPVLFSELAERFPDKMPSEELLKNYLTRKGFAPAALSSVVSAYRETSEIVDHESVSYDSKVAHTEESSPMVQVQTGEPNSSAGLAKHSLLIGTSSEERSMGRYDYEGGAYVRIAASGDINTEEALDMVETLIKLKRAELQRKNKHANADAANPIGSKENENNGLL